MSFEKKEVICFPFDSLEGINLKLDMELNEEENVEKETDDFKQLNKLKFKTKRYYLNENGKKRIIKKGRKYKPDDIRKKIKVKIHKTLKTIMNNNLKKAGSFKFFKYLPQLFIGNISQKFNYNYLEFTYKDLLLTDFTICGKEYKNKKIDYNNYLNNKGTVEYLEQNIEISINSGFYLIKNMKYKDILKAYFSSKEFEYSILELKNKKEDSNYIIDYVNLSKTYLDYFGKINKKEENEIKEDPEEYFTFGVIEKHKNNLNFQNLNFLEYKLN